MKKAIEKTWLRSVTAFISYTLKSLASSSILIFFLLQMEGCSVITQSREKEKVSKMQAIVMKKYGGVDVLSLENVDEPKLRPGQVKVRNYAAAVNPIDWKIRRGSPLHRLFGGILLSPRILGCDFAGVVVAVSKDVKNFKVGDQVYGVVSPFSNGTYAQQLCTEEKNMAPIPQGLTFSEAASLPVAALTAYRALVELGKIKEGQHVVINGCSGGVGIMALQIAKANKAVVTGVCSKRNRELAISLGADEVIDYEADPGLTSMGSCDIFFDVVGTKTYSSVVKLINKDGCYITDVPFRHVSSFLSLTNSLRKVKFYDFILDGGSKARFEYVNSLIDRGQLKTIIAKEYELNKVALAHQASESGHVVGKLVIIIPQD